MQQGKAFELKKRAIDGSPVWAYRYRTCGPASRRLQGGFSSERDAADALERARERSQPDHDRPPLRPPRPRRTRARTGSSTATRRSNPPTSNPWKVDGRRTRESSPESPLTDLNRRPPPYH